MVARQTPLGPANQPKANLRSETLIGTADSPPVPEMSVAAASGASVVVAAISVAVDSVGHGMVVISPATPGRGSVVVVALVVVDAATVVVGRVVGSIRSAYLDRRVRQ